ncbi:replication endonuclease [Chromohalobacter nigrandesensis]|uniref:replication endonuclease n=1 Tax=Chromohalobacter nigrandesensis TaxID=119863 RepID=UPI001FF420C7|nr:replication endonuclease [Chromohalobacter nigrandesensis]MCK0745026.1 replication endonuclease [Chromohalobacter nigrandesensis]
MTTHAAAIDRQVLADSLRRCGPWYCTTDDDALTSHASAQARAVATEAASLGDDVYAYQRAARRVERHQLDAPTGYGHRGGLARMACPLWWRRQLRRLNARRLEQRERVLGRVHDRAGIYVSHQGLSQRRAQQHRNRELLAGLVATNQHAQEYTLAELAELGLANPDHRRAELMLRLADTEDEANRLGHVGMFYTLTCPSRFHAVIKGTARVNRHYDGSTPREAQAYLTKLWNKARAKFGRDGLGFYGIRVVEPHHDGCPHWHLLLWCEPADEPAITAILRRYALADSPHEIDRRPGDSDAKAKDREQKRFKPVRIDPARGSAAGYVAKYICKNINGKQHVRGEVEGDHLDHYGHDLTSSAPRIEAWAATWGIRQFQFYGLPSVGVWRELRRLTTDADVEAWEQATRPEPEAAAILGELRRACLGNQWAEFLRLMGGPMTKRDDQPARPWRFEKLDDTGRYGDPVPATYGVAVSSQVGTAEYLTRLYRWTVERKPSDAGFDFEKLGVGGSAAAWTGVNNCTPPDAAPHRDPLNDWEWHVTESFRRMNPAPDPENVRRLRLQIAHDAEQYRHESAQRIAAAQAERHRLQSIREGEDIVRQWLANGKITLDEAAEVLTA